MLRKLPATLWAWFVISLVVEVANIVIRMKLHEPGRGELSWLDDAFAVTRGTALVRSLFITLALFELARRLDGPARTAMRAAGWITGGGFALVIIDLTVGTLHAEKLRTVLEYAWKVEAVAFYAALGCIFYAGRSWTTARDAMVLVAITALLRNWLPYLSDAIQQAVFDAKLQGWYYGALGFAWTFAFGWLLAVIARDAREPHLDGERADSGFHLAARALWFRVAAAGIAAVLTLLAASGTSGGGKGMIAFVFVIAPAIVVATAAAFVVGIARAAESRIANLSPVLLVVGAAPVLWSLAPQLQLVGAALAAVLDLEGPRMEPVLGITSAIALTAGFLLICIAIAGCRASQDTGLATAATSATVAILALQFLAIGVQHYAKPTSQSEALLLLFFVAAANIVTVVLLARLLARAGKAFASGISIPTARVVE